MPSISTIQYGGIGYIGDFGVGRSDEGSCGGLSIWNVNDVTSGTIYAGTSTPGFGLIREETALSIVNIVLSSVALVAEYSKLNGNSVSLPLFYCAHGTCGMCLESS